MSDKEQIGAPNHRDVEINIDAEMAQGRYANLAIISHSPTEFIIDFAAMLPGMAKPTVNNRVIITPEHAKRLLSSLQENITRYETQHGNISTPAATKGQEAMAHINKLGEA